MSDLKQFYQISYHEVLEVTVNWTGVLANQTATWQIPLSKVTAYFVKEIFSLPDCDVNIAGKLHTAIEWMQVTYKQSTMY